ncbi:hypothetical protein NLG97_g728 [Lecanicillium saksenae]|uniref:Uncharacterized protein n=1 Tax=Lecanicillium saksenae TaxID=468837 RepID=A0ACC1R5R1_9HYPO|nr:hypothetical protein NLG97_g728 [Lecanicillium saksenae]
MAPPKRVLVEKSGRRGAAPKGYIASTYDALTSPENASVVRSLAVFGVAVAFLNSPFSDFLLPPGHSRPPEAPITGFDGANTMPRRGLAHLVSKFESLDKATSAHRRQPSFPRQPLGLTPSKTMSSLSLFQDNRRYFEKGCQKQSEKLASFKTPSPAAAAAASIRRTSSSAHKPQDVATPNRTGHNDRVAASVAEKRKFFESDESSARDPADGLCTPKTKTPRTAASSVLQAAKSDRKLPLSQSCEHIYSTPTTIPTSPTKYIFSISSLQNSRHSQRENPKGTSVHSVPASSFVVRVHHKSELRNSTREDECRSRKSEAPKQPPLRTTYISPTGSPIKSPKRLDTAAVGTASRDVSPVSSPKKAMDIASSPSSPSPTTREKEKESSRNITPKSVGSGESIIITKRDRADPSRAKGWSPQRIVTPQTPTMPQKISPIHNAEGHGTFVRSRKPENFRDALGFFEAMSNTGSVASTCYTAPSGGRGSLKAMRSAEKHPSKREKLKGSLRKLSASWRLRQAPTVGKTEAPLEYPAMWKIGSIDSTPRKRLHAGWSCLIRIYLVMRPHLVVESMHMVTWIFFCKNHRYTTIAQLVNLDMVRVMKLQIVHVRPYKAPPQH